MTLSGRARRPGHSGSSRGETPETAGTPGQFEQVEVRSAGELRRWLEARHQQTASVWLVTHRKAAGAAYLAWSELVDELLAFGWIDSLPRTLDDGRTMHLISPRRKGSAWSAINRAKVERLIAAGRMHPAGLAKVEAAKADGAWTLLDGIDPDAPPADLVTELAATPGAAANFAAFPKSSRRAILEWIGRAKGSDTRAKRIAETARLAGENIMANHPEGRNRPKPKR